MAKSKRQKVFLINEEQVNNLKDLSKSIKEEGYIDPNLDTLINSLKEIKPIGYVLGNEQNKVIRGQYTRISVMDIAQAKKLKGKEEIILKVIE